MHAVSKALGVPAGVASAHRHECIVKPHQGARSTDWPIGKMRWRTVVSNGWSASGHLTPQPRRPFFTSGLALNRL